MILLTICQSVKMSRGGISRTKYYIKNRERFYKNPPLDRLTD